MSDNPYSEQPETNPYQQPAGGGGGDPIYAEIKKQATASMIWGIVSIFCCGIILGPFAVWRANKAKQMIAENNQGHEFASQAQIGFVTGIIGIVLFLLMFGLQVVFAVLGAAAGA